MLPQMQFSGQMGNYISPRTWAINNNMFPPAYSAGGYPPMGANLI